MARDMLDLMKHLGHASFHVVGHDRGAYVAFRLAMDHPSAVTRLTIIDAVPILEAVERCDSRFAASWWHWFFFAQPEKPERAINADPNAWYGDSPHKRAQMGDDAWADYQAAICDPQTIHCMLEDYRAGLGVDCEHDREDRAAGRQLSCPTTVLWARYDDLEQFYGDPLEVWRPWAPQLDGMGIACGHHIAEEAPALLADLLAEQRSN